MQSRSLLLLLAVSLVFSCSRNNYYEHQLLSTLPSPDYNSTVDVFYENGTVPDKDYIEFYDLRVVKKGSYNDKQMVKFLKEEARNKGLDAIANLRTWDEVEEKSTLLDVIANLTDDDDFDYTTTVNYSIIEGKGIRYVENIDLSKSVKLGKVYTADDVYVGEISFLPNGRIEETTAENEAASLLLDTYYKLSEDHLLHEQQDWQTLHYPDGRIDVRRKYRLNDWLLERVRVRYDGNHGNRIRAIRLTENPSNNELVTKINYIYNKSGQLVERKTTGSTLFKEKARYEQGKITETKLQFGGSQYLIKYEFYQQSDLKQLIKKVEGTH